MEVARSVVRQFSRVAANYDTRAGVQRAVARALVRDTTLPLPCQTAVDLGCGTGFASCALLERCPHARIDAVDIAPGMIAYGKSRTDDPRIRWHVGDARSFTGQGDGTYDLVISSSALQWIRPEHAVSTRARALLRPGGVLAISGMLRGTLAELRALRREVSPESAPIEELPDRSDVVRAIVDAGFTLREQRISAHVEYAGSFELFLKVIRAQGVTGGALSHGDRTLSRGELREIGRRYEARYRTPLGLAARYIVLTVEAEAR